MSNIPETTTHIWTPAYQTPYVQGLMRRAFYRKIEDKWQSYSSVRNDWFFTQNEDAWFDEEIKLGYFVPVEIFNSPDFTCKEENV